MASLLSHDTSFAQGNIFHFPLRDETAKLLHCMAATAAAWLPLRAAT